MKTTCMPFKIAFYLVCCYVMATGAMAQEVSQRFSDFFATHPGSLHGNIAVAENGRMVFQYSHGFADYHSHTLNTEHSRFNLASVSKVFTSTAVLQLVEKKRLSLEDPLTKYFPAFPYPDIRIRHLLSHTSGLPDLELYEDIVKNFPDTVITNAAALPALSRWKNGLYFSPGEKWRYCNTNYVLLALLLEKTSGMTFARYLERNIFKPAGMVATDVFDHRKNYTAHTRAVTKHVLPVWYTQQYVTADSVKRFRYTHYNCSGTVGDNNIITTTADMLKFDEAFFNGKLLSKSMMALAFTPVRLNDGSVFYEASMDVMLGAGKGTYGLGWDIFEQPGFGKGVGHGGFNRGLLTFYYHNLSRNQAIIAFDNTAGSDFREVVTSSLHLLNNAPAMAIKNKQSLARIYGAAMKERSIHRATTLLNTMKSDTANYYISERELNWLGYDFLFADFDNHVGLALEVMKVNTLLFPGSFNVYDSYAEALAAHGLREEAIMMYKKSLMLNPDNKGGREALKKLMGD